MVYAYDLWALMPTKDLYDSKMMIAAISAAKDMYDKGEEAVKEFRKEYGNFYTPTRSHQQMYELNFNVGDFLQGLYDRGIDPSRSSEGRSLVLQWIDTRPYEKLAKAERSLDVYNIYLKNKADLQAKNLYSKEFEDFENKGKTIENLGEDETWEKMSPQPYQKLGEYTDNLFSGMKDEFIMYDPNTGKDWYGVSRDRRYKALTDNMGSVLSTDLGRFHYEQSRNNARQALGREPNEAEVMEQFKQDVLTETHKYDHTNFKENPEYARRREFSYNKALRAGTPGYDSNGNPIQQDYDSYDFQTRLYLDSVGNVFGVNYKAFDPLAMGDKINEVLRSVFNSAGLNKTATQDLASFRNVMNGFIMQDAIDNIQFAKYTETVPVSDTNGTHVGPNNVNKLYSDMNIGTYTYGYRGKINKEYTNNERDILKAHDNIVMDPTGEVYGAKMRDGVFHTYARVYVYSPDGSMQSVTGESKYDGFYMWYDLGIKSNKTFSDTEPQDLNPSWRNLHTRLSRSNNVGKATFGNQTDPTFIPELGWPKTN